MATNGPVVVESQPLVHSPFGPPHVEHQVHHRKSPVISGYAPEKFRTVIDKEDQVQVHIPQGKWYLSEPNKVYQQDPQKDFACVLYARQRIGTRYGDRFDSKKCKERFVEEVMNDFREEMTFLARNGFNEYICTDIVKVTLEALKKLNIDPTKHLIDTSFYKLFMKHYGIRKETVQESEIKNHFATLPANDLLNILYEILLTNTMPSMEIMPSDWHPKDGPQALMRSLREHSAHMFIGKFGEYFHITAPDEMETFSTENRKVYIWKSGTFNDAPPFSHAIVVDELRKIGEKYFVFFQDPDDLSRPDQPEKVFMMSYDAFVDRLTSIGGYGYHVDLSDITVGWTPRPDSKRM